MRYVSLWKSTDNEEGEKDIYVIDCIFWETLTSDGKLSIQIIQICSSSFKYLNSRVIFPFVKKDVPFLSNFVKKNFIIFSI